jgi:hypothetical protein
MLSKIFKKKQDPKQENEITSQIVEQMTLVLNQFNNKLDLRFNEISAQIKDLELSISSLEKQLLNKDLKDKQALGMLHYKIEEKRKPNF